MDEKKLISKKAKLKMILIIVLVFLLATAGLTYAFFTIEVEGNEDAQPMRVISADLKLVYTDVQLLMKSSAFPGWSDTKTFTVENTGNISTPYIIKFREVKNGILNGDLVLSATCTSSIDDCDDLPERAIPASTTELTDVYMYGPIYIEAGDTHTYTLTVQYKERGINQKYNKGASFYGTLNIGDGTPTDESLFEYTVSNNNVTITGYNRGTATYEVADTSACEEYFGEDNWDASDPDLLCAGEMNSDDETIEQYLISETLPSSDYAEAGLSNVVLNKTSRDIIIPSTIDGKTVTAIGNYALRSYKFTSIVLPETLTTIGTQGLSGNLIKTIVFPENVTTMGNYVLANTSNITSVYLPSSVTSVGEYSFYNTQSLITLSISSGMTFLDHGLAQSSKLKMIMIPDNITSMDTFVFNNSQIEYAYISSGLTQIPTSTFQTNSLTSIDIPSNITTIGSNAFYDNYLTEVTIPSSVMAIGYRAFYGSSSIYRKLESVKIQTKTNSGQFTSYGSNIWGWKSNVTCVTNNTSNVTNGCITWGVS